MEAIKKEVIDNLVEFIKIASKEDATPEMIAALPEVAKLVLDFEVSVSYQ